MCRNASFGLPTRTCPSKFAVGHLLVFRDSNMKRTTWLAIAWTLFILFACWLPSDRMPIPEPDADSFWKLKVPHLDKVAHFGFFAIFAILWLRARVSYNRVLLAGLGLALLSEAGQAHPLVHRDASLDDLIADLLGVLAAKAFLTLWPIDMKTATIHEPPTLSPLPESSA